MTTTILRYSVTYDYPAPCTVRVEVRVMGGTSEENHAEARRVSTLLLGTERDGVPLSGLTGTLRRCV